MHQQMVRMYVVYDSVSHPHNDSVALMWTVAFGMSFAYGHAMPTQE